LVENKIEAYLRQHARDLRLHVLHPDTKIIEGYHVYNEVTDFSAFFEKYGNRYRTIMQPNTGQKKDLKINKNIL
jgi:hypothetical protein